MRTLVAQLTLAAVVVALGSAAVVACGGNDKPPLTPDLVEPVNPPDAPDAAPPPPPAAK